MTDREERQHVIEILQKEKKTALHDNKWAFDYAIASIKTDLRYDLLYEETSTENCIACKYDEIEESDGKHCAKCLAGDSQFEVDKEFVQTTKNDVPDINVGKIGSTPKNDLAIIYTGGLDEDIRCAMCTNSMANDRGCDGGCVVDETMYKKVMDVIENHIVDTDKMTGLTTKNDLGVDSTPNTISFKEMIDNLKITAEDIENAEDLEYSIEPLIRPKNNLGVDAVSRQAINRYINYILSHGMGKKKSFDFIKKFVANLPSVTPIRPKGHWKLVQRGKSIDICCSNCKAVRIKGYAYNYTIDQLNKEDLKECFECDDMQYCPNCGSDNREVEE